MSRRLEKLNEQKAWETLTDYGRNDAQLIEQLTDATIEKLTEQATGRPDPFNPPPGSPRIPGPGSPLSSWNNIIGMINQVMETISQGLPQHSEFDAMVSMVDYDNDGQVTFDDLTIALSLWSQGFMPVNAQDYQAGLLIVDESGLGEQLPPEGEELLNVLSGQGSLGMFNPMDAFDQSIRTQTGATTRRITPTGPPAPRTFNPTVSRTGPRLGMGGPPAMPGGMG